MTKARTRPGLQNIAGRWSDSGSDTPGVRIQFLSSTPQGPRRGRSTASLHEPGRIFWPANRRFWSGTPAGGAPDFSGPRYRRSPLRWDLRLLSATLPGWGTVGHDFRWRLNRPDQSRSNRRQRGVARKTGVLKSGGDRAGNDTRRQDLPSQAMRTWTAPGSGHSKKTARCPGQSKQQREWVPLRLRRRRSGL